MTMKDAEVQLAGHEERLHVQEELSGYVRTKLDEIHATVTDLRTRVALAHSPDTCPLRGRVRALGRVVEELQQLRWLALGGGRVILWLVGGGALGIGALLGWLAR